MRAYEISRVFRDVAWTIAELNSYTYEGRCAFKDYQAGLYFDRDWYLNGADPNMIGPKTSPTMEVKEESVTYEQNCICRRFQITVRVQDCIDCEVLPDAVSILAKFLEQLAFLELYQVDDDQIWLTPLRADALRPAHVVTPLNKGIFPYQLTRRQTISKPVQDAARTEVIVCFADSVELDYGVPLLPDSALVNDCISC